MRKDISVGAMFSDCQILRTVSNVQQIMHQLAYSGYRILIFPELGKPGIPLLDKDIDSYFSKLPIQAGLTTSAKGEIGLPITRGISVPNMEGITTSFYLEFYSGRMAVKIGGLLDFEFRDQRPLVEPFANRMLELAKAFYAQLQPALCVIGEPHLILRDVIQRKLKQLNWVNIFSPTYVAKYRREFFLNLPGYRVEEWSDGTIYHQLYPTFSTENFDDAHQLQQKIIDYCAEAGLNVNCNAPYYIKNLQGSNDKSL